MTLDTLIETGKILSYSEGESLAPRISSEGYSTGRLDTIYETTIIYYDGKRRTTQYFYGTTRKDVTQQVIKYFS